MTDRTFFLRLAIVAASALLVVALALVVAAEINAWRGEERWRDDHCNLGVFSKTTEPRCR